MELEALVKLEVEIKEVLRVLIVDDDPPTRMILRAALSQWGFEVLEAKDGEEAWRLINQPNPPRLLILDWLMPNLDGIGLCNLIKSKMLMVQPYIILLSQVAGTANIVKALEAGANEFISKPFNMAELRSRLSVAVRMLKYETMLLEQNDQLQKCFSQMETIAEFEQHITEKIAAVMLSGDLLIKNPLTLNHLQKIKELQDSFHNAIRAVKDFQAQTKWMDN